MTTDKSSVRILIYNDCGTEKFLNVFFPVIYTDTLNWSDFTRNNDLNTEFEPFQKYRDLRLV